jgi:regulator of PEP synthase PpsR (kinase-PPPase family)
MRTQREEHWQEEDAHSMIINFWLFFDEISNYFDYTRGAAAAACVDMLSSNLWQLKIYISSDPSK